MKIDVIHLAEYLPHKVEFSGGGDRWTLYSVGADGDIVLKNGLHTQVVNHSGVGVEYLPILKPLSRFRDNEMRTSVQRVSDDLNCIRDENEFVNWYLAKDNPFLHQSDSVKEYMLKNHYDIFGLIGFGLAVDYYSVS